MEPNNQVSFVQYKKDEFRVELRKKKLVKIFEKKRMMLVKSSENDVYVKKFEKMNEFEVSSLSLSKIIFN